MKSATTGVGYALGGSGILCLVGTFLIGMFILSLIPIYIPNESTNGYGEIYVIPGFTIKAVFTNLSVNFTGGNIINLQDLSTICTQIFRAKQVQDFYACVASNFTAYGPTGYTDPTSALRRRRELNDVAVYEIGNMYLLFRNTCASQRPLGQWSLNISHTQNSSCYARRAAACRAFITTPNTGSYGNQWYPLPAGYTQLIVTNYTGCAAISVTNIANVYYYNYARIYGTYANNTVRNALNAGDCQLSSISPLSTLYGLVNNETYTNTSVCTYVIG